MKNKLNFIKLFIIIKLVSTTGQATVRSCLYYFISLLCLPLITILLLTHVLV